MRWIKIVKVAVILTILALLLFFSCFRLSAPSLTKLTLQDSSFVRVDDTVKVGWAQLSILPEFPVELAGYGPGRGYTSVQDTPMVSVICFKTGVEEIYMINMDLLIFPPPLANRLRAENPDGHFYFAASHTHHSLGGWSPSVGGQWITRDFNPKVVSHLFSQTKEAMAKAAASASHKVRYMSRNLGLPSFIYNRLDKKNGSSDSAMRIHLFNHPEKASFALLSFAAHPTVLGVKDPVISNDYPGRLAGALDSMGVMNTFAAGAVGSQSLKFPTRSHQHGYDSLKQLIVNEVNDMEDQTEGKAPITSLSFTRKIFEPLEPAMRITENIHIREWLFSALFGTLHADLVVLQLNQHLFFGLPADYSGEYSRRLLETAQDFTITGFNGNYIGYLIPENQYDNIIREETTVMHWAPRETGSFYYQNLKDLLNNYPFSERTVN